MLFLPLSQQNNMNALNSDLNALCLDPDYQGEPGLCQLIAEDVDVVANTLIGEESVSLTAYSILSSGPDIPTEPRGRCGQYQYP